MAKGRIPSDEEWKILGELVRWWEAHKHLIHRTGGTAADPETHPGALVVCLLESIESGQTGRAAVLTKGIPGRERQLVDMRGDITGTETFTLTLDGYGTTSAIPVTATGAEVRAALEALPGINSGDVNVGLGNHTRAVGGLLNAFPLRRWIVEFTGQFAAEDVPLLEATGGGGGTSPLFFSTTEDTQLVDSGRTEFVYAPIPVGEPTPLKAPAIAVCVWSTEFGWTIVSVEPRGILGVY